MKYPIILFIIITFVGQANSFDVTKMVKCNAGLDFSRCIVGDKLSSDGQFNDGVFKVKCEGNEYAMKVVNDRSEMVGLVKKTLKTRKTILRAHLSKTEPSPDLTKIKAIKYDPRDRLIEINNLMRSKQIKSFVPIEDVCGISQTFVLMPLAIKPTFNEICLIKLVDDLLNLITMGLVHDDIKESNIMAYNNMCSFIDHDSLCIENHDHQKTVDIPCIISDYVPLLKHRTEGDVFYIKTLIHNKIGLCDPKYKPNEITDQNRFEFGVTELKTCRREIFNKLKPSEKELAKVGFYPKELEEDIF